MKVFIIVNDKPNQLSELTFRYNPTIISAIKTVPGSKFAPELKKWYIPSDQINNLNKILAKSNILLVVDLSEEPIDYSPATSFDYPERLGPNPLDYPERLANKRQRFSSTEPTETIDLPNNTLTNSMFDTQSVPAIIKARFEGDGSLKIDLPLPFPIYYYLKESVKGIVWEKDQWIIKPDLLEQFYKICSTKGYKMEYTLAKEEK